MKNRNLRIMVSLVSCLALLSHIWIELTPSASAAGNHFDGTFGATGIITTDLSNSDDFASDLAVLPDGKIVVAGSTRTDLGDDLTFALARYNSNGSLDTSFSGDGKVKTPVGSAHSGIRAVALQPDGKIVAAGYAYNAGVLNFAVVRYTTDGSVDTTFNGGAVLTPFTLGTGAVSEAFDLAIQPDGKIVVVGVVSGTVGSQVVDDWAIARYTAIGILDPVFSGDGKLLIDFNSNLNTSVEAASAVAIALDGKIVIGGTVSPNENINFGVARLSSNGIPDATFDNDGKTNVDFNQDNDRLNALTLQADGKIVVAGSVVNVRPVFGLARFNSNGDLDTTFDSNGKVTTDFPGENSDSVRGVVIQADGKIVAGGSSVDPFGSSIVLARYNPNGSLDASFGLAGRLFADLGDATFGGELAISSDGRLIVVASDRYNQLIEADFMVARYLPNVEGKFDYDGDSEADLSVFRPSTGTWYILRSQGFISSVGFGVSSDKIVPADYDGDGRTDIAVYRPAFGIWYAINSSTNTLSTFFFGIAEDLPAPADYDGDGKAERAVFRPSTGTWYRINSGSGAFVSTQFGATGDKPTVGDFDGDGRADLAVYRPSAGSWYRLNSSDGAFVPTAFGISTDVVAPADFDGDGKTDISVFRPSVGTWYRLDSSTGAFISVQFGTNGDLPVPADYDHDGKADISVFRPVGGVWYRMNSGGHGGLFSQQWGQTGDRPTPAAFQY